MVSEESALKEETGEGGRATRVEAVRCIFLEGDDGSEDAAGKRVSSLILDVEK